MTFLQNKTVKPLVFAIVASASLLAVPVLEAKPENSASSQQSYQEHGRSFHKHLMKKMARKLDLSDEQQAEIKKIYRAAKEKKIENKSWLKNYRQQVKQLMLAETFDEQAFLNLRQEYNDNFTNMELSKVKTKHAIAQVLTPEQRKKWQSFRQHKKMRKMRS